MREFNTSGPNDSTYHYTIIRKNFIEAGEQLIARKKYFTVWAPRQTGKSTWFRQLTIDLEENGYEVAHINFESYRNAPLESFLTNLVEELNKFWNINLPLTDISNILYRIEQIKNRKLVLIVDEVEGINPAYFGDFLHSIRKAYHNRSQHSLHSVILVGVSNITGIVQDNASPFNVADNMAINYFTNAETKALLAQHEQETGQLFAAKVKQKIIKITANQPGLVNGFANQLVTRHPNKKRITYRDYLEVEHWYLNLVIDKNVANIVKIAKQHRPFVERLLFDDRKIKFQIGHPAIEKLHINGLITWDKEGFVKFWVPLYRKRLHDAFYPYSNGESQHIMHRMPIHNILDEAGNFRMNTLIDSFKVYIQKRGFRPFREKDENGAYKSIPEAVMVYSFETYLQAFLQMVDGKSYREAQTALGNSDLIINISNQEYLIETKIYRFPKQFEDGKKQLAYYAKSLGLKAATYLVFLPNTITYPIKAKEGIEVFKGIEVQIFLVPYDEVKEFGADDF
ncbi:MAG: AAA-like domain-containing protein [Saprospiraceae bacterium]